MRWLEFMVLINDTHNFLGYGHNEWQISWFGLWYLLTVIGDIIIELIQIFSKLSARIQNNYNLSNGRLFLYCQISLQHCLYCCWIHCRNYCFHPQVLCFLITPWLYEPTAENPQFLQVRSIHCNKLRYS